MFLVSVRLLDYDASMFHMCRETTSNKPKKIFIIGKVQAVVFYFWRILNMVLVLRFWMSRFSALCAGICSRHA